MQDLTLDNTQSRPPNGGSADSAISILLGEMSMLSQSAHVAVELSNKRVDVLLLATSAAFGGLTALGSFGIEVRAFLTISVIAAFAVLGLGIVTYDQVLRLDILHTEYMRAINRARAGLVDLVKQVGNYLLMPTDHTYPPYRWGASNRRLPMVINGLCAGASTALIAALLKSTAVPGVWDLALSLVVFAVTCYLQSEYSNCFIEEAENAARVARGDETRLGNTLQKVLATRSILRLTRKRVLQRLFRFIVPSSPD